MGEEDLICPYCGAVQNCHEADEFSALMCNTECESCGKLFWYSVDVTREYSPYKGEDKSDEK